MNQYEAPLADFSFLLFDVMQAHQTYSGLAGYEEFSPDRDGPYRRVLTAVRTGSGPRAAWIYCTPRPPAGGVRLRGGRWRRR